MSVDLRKKISEILFEDTWNKYGSEYMSHPYSQVEEEPSNLPEMPSDLTSNQLAVEKPPVEDGEYVPGGVKELSYAAAALAEKVPQSQVEYFYSKIKSLVKSSIERNSSHGEDPSIEKEENEAAEAELESETMGSGAYANPVEESLRKKIRDF